MQGSKIKAAESYATSFRGELERFFVSAVTIVKKGDHASDQTVTVTGRYLDKDGNRDSHEATLPAGALLGHYTEYTTLVAAEAAKKAADTAKAKADEAEQERLWRRLYELTGYPLPQGKKSRWRNEETLEYSASEGDMFHRTYRGGFEVTQEGAEVLIAALERAARLKVVNG